MMNRADESDPAPRSLVSMVVFQITFHPLETIDQQLFQLRRLRFQRDFLYSDDGNQMELSTEPFRHDEDEEIIDPIQQNWWVARISKRGIDMAEMREWTQPLQHCCFRAERLAVDCPNSRDLASIVFMQTRILASTEWVDWFGYGTRSQKTNWQMFKRSSELTRYDLLITVGCLKNGCKRKWKTVSGSDE